MALGDDYAETTELADAFRIGDSVDDVHLDRAISAASRWVANYCGRDFAKAATATTRTFRASSSGRVWVDDIATSDGLVVATGTGLGTFDTAWTDSDYSLEPVTPALGWPYTGLSSVGTLAFPYVSGRPTVQVTAVWGWPEVPDDVKQATLIYAAKLYKRRDSAEGVLAGFGDYGPIRVGVRTDPDVEALLSPYRYPVAVG